MTRPYTNAAPKAPPIEDPQDKHFYSTDGSDIRVPHPDGDVAIVNEPRTLPLKFHRLAAKAGCMMRSVNPGETPSQAKTNARKSQRKQVTQEPTADEIAGDPLLRDKAIETAINDALDAEEGAEGFENAWTADDKINLQWLAARVGFIVEQGERDVIQARVLAESGDDEEEEEGQD